MAVADSIVIVHGGPAGLGRAMTRTLENVKRGMDRASVETARWGVARMVQETAVRKVDASTQFKRQWKVIKFPGGAATANTATYAEFVERGRGPGRAPPIEALEEWIRLRGAKVMQKAPSRQAARAAVSKMRRVTGDVSSAKNRRRIRANMNTLSKIYRSKGARISRQNAAIRGLALAIARKIAKKGTKPKWLLRDALVEFKAFAASRYEAAVRRVARNPLGRYTKA